MVATDKCIHILGTEEVGKKTRNRKYVYFGLACSKCFIFFESTLGKFRLYYGLHFTGATCSRSHSWDLGTARTQLESTLSNQSSSELTTPQSLSNKQKTACHISATQELSFQSWASDTSLTLHQPCLSSPSWSQGTLEFQVAIRLGHHRQPGSRTLLGYTVKNFTLAEGKKTMFQFY